jgi:hypothetical protein
VTDPTPLSSAAGGSFENVPTAMVFDTFTEAAAALRSHYMRLSDEAKTALEPDVWWGRILDLRDAEHAVGADDRDALIEHIAKWRTELAALKASERG